MTKPKRKSTKKKVAQKKAKSKKKSTKKKAKQPKAATKKTAADDGFKLHLDNILNESGDLFGDRVKGLFAEMEDIVEARHRSNMRMAYVTGFITGLVTQELRPDIDSMETAEQLVMSLLANS